MTRNPILEEIYAAREKLLADHGGDVKKYLESVREREAATGHVVGGTTQRTNQCTGAATSGELPVENQSSPPGDR